jgi:parvulin-like peptidyl-prolyl isomerase
MTFFVLLALALPAAPPDTVVAEVNGRRLTQSDLRAFLVIRGAPADVSPSFRSRATSELVDRELIRQFLERIKTVAEPAAVDAAVRAAMERVAMRSQDSATILASLGVEEARLRSELAVSIAWRHHVGRVLTDRQIREHFDRHRRRFDGTRLRVSQIFVKYEPGESPSHAAKTAERLQVLRREIAGGKTSFADAAKAHSEAPTAASGGDVGWIGPRGDLPTAVTRAAYALRRGEVSEGIVSPFGAHLVVITDLKAGDLSLEDARPPIVEELSQTLWDETVASERKAAKIVMGD